MASGPLDGIKVLEFTQIIAGPFCCQLLADMGATVTKFEPIEGEPWRVFAELIPKESRVFLALNRGKRGVAMDLTRTEAIDAVRKMVADADVMVINYRPGVAEKLGIDYDSLREINPRLIYCENSAFGKQGPLAKAGGYDIIVQAMTGLMAGEAKMLGNVPEPITPAVADFSTGILMSNAICAALYVREKTGRGQYISSTMLAMAMNIQPSNLTYLPAWDDVVVPAMLADLKVARAEKKPFADQLAINRRTRLATPGNIYYRVFQTADGFVTVGALSMALRHKVIAATGLKDPRMTAAGGFILAPEGWDGLELVAEAEALFLTKSTQEWLDTLSHHGVPCGPLYFVEELWENEQVLANNLVVELEHELLGPMKMAGPAFQMSETPLAVQGSSPPLGRDTDAALAEAGYSEAEIDELRESGVIR
ncbi:MAG: CaiB/BaiF CoA transferase family protein [Tepidiformaceae bacterium]